MAGEKKREGQRRLNTAIDSAGKVNRIPAGNREPYGMRIEHSRAAVGHRERPHVVKPRESEIGTSAECNFADAACEILREIPAPEFADSICGFSHWREIELPHLLQISFRELPAKPGLEIARQPLQQFGSVDRALFAAVLMFHQTPPHQPVRGRQDRIDRLRSVLAPALKEFRDADSSAWFPVKICVSESCPGDIAPLQSAPDFLPLSYFRYSSPIT